jgi:fumarate hydratase, class II
MVMVDTGRSGIVKIGRTHMQDATPLTLGQEWSGYAGMQGAHDALVQLSGTLRTLAVSL